MASFGSATTGGSGSATSHSFAQPAGLANSDKLLLHIIVQNLAATITPPSGFTLFRTVTRSFSRVLVYYKDISDIGSEPDPYNVTASANVSLTGTLMRIVGAVAGAPVDENFATADSSATIVAPAVTTTENNSLIVVAGSYREGTHHLPTIDDVDFTQRSDSVNGFGRATLFTKVLATAGGSGTPELTYGGSKFELYANSYAFNDSGAGTVYDQGAGRFEGAVEFQGELSKYIHIASGKFEGAVEFQGELSKYIHIASGRFEAATSMFGEFTRDVAGRFEIASAFSSSALRDYIVRGRFEIASDFAAQVSKEFHILTGRFEVAARMKTGYIGRGTGLVLYFPAHLTEKDEIGAYQYQKILNNLRVGSEFSGFFPLAGSQGKTGKVRILSMKYSEDKEFPEYEVQLIEHQDPDVIHHLKEASSVPFIPKIKGNLFRNVAQLRRRT